MDLKKTIVTTLIFFLIGCSGVGGGSVFPDNPLAEYKKLNSVSTVDQKKIALDADMLEALRFCRTVLNYYERSAKKSSNWLTAIALTGSIAGGVIVPALSAQASVSNAAVAGFGGLSGVANAAQNSITGNGLGPESFLSTRSKINSGIETVMTNYYLQDSYTEKANSVLSMYAKCIANDITAEK